MGNILNCGEGVVSANSGLTELAEATHTPLPFQDVEIIPNHGGGFRADLRATRRSSAGNPPPKDGRGARV